MPLQGTNTFRHLQATPCCLINLYPHSHLVRWIAALPSRKIVRALFRNHTRKPQQSWLRISAKDLQIPGPDPIMGQMMFHVQPRSGRHIQGLILLLVKSVTVQIPTRKIAKVFDNAGVPEIQILTLSPENLAPPDQPSADRNSTHSDASGNGKDFFIPMKLDPIPAPGPSPIARRDNLDARSPPQLESKPTSKDYFSNKTAAIRARANEQEPVQKVSSAESAQGSRNSSQPSSPHIAHQYQDRGTTDIVRSFERHQSQKDASWQQYLSPHNGKGARSRIQWDRAPCSAKR